MAANKQEYEKYYFFMLVFAYAIILLNVYYFSHPFFAGLGLSHDIAVKVLLQMRDGGIFKTPYMTKLAALILLVFTHVVRGGKGKKVNWWAVGVVGAIGLFLYLIWPEGTAVYLVTTITGFMLTGWSIASISRNFAAFKDPNNDPLESWQQCEELIDTPDSINLAIRYKWKGKYRKAWANVLNPFRATMILGTPGAGKSFSIFNPFIQQAIAKDYVAMCYDYKYPDLSKIVFNEYLLKYPAIENPDYTSNNGQPKWIKDPKAPSFYIINFNDPRRSHRCNPIHPSYIKDPADSAEIADIVMKNVAPGTVEKEDFFSMSAKVYLDAIVYFLSIYEGGKYCTFPHVIELMSIDYKKVFSILAGYDELETKIKPFASALEAGAQDQLQGQIASATIPLNKMASPALYWVLSGDDFTLDLNNPQAPKFLCIGNDPDRQAIYGTALALFTSRVFKLINHKGKRKIMIFLDELPTIFIKGLDNLIATARSNKVAIVMGAQDKSQLIRDYSEKEANVIFNTVGTYFVGQVLGRTAEEMSKSFGREYREQQSQTQNIDSESIQRSYHQEELLQISTIENLSQGFFFGRVADNNDTIIEQKMFYGQRIIDVKAWNERRSHDQPMPIITSFDDDEIRAECHEEVMAESILRTWCVQRILEDGIIYQDEVMEDKINALIRTLTDREKDRILDEEAELLIMENMEKCVQDNFIRIRNEVKAIVEKELPGDYNGTDDDDEEDETNPLDELAA
jgi:hypothetical protein